MYYKDPAAGKKSLHLLALPCFPSSLHTPSLQSLKKSQPYPLHTTAAAYPWYATSSTIAVNIPLNAEQAEYTYQYAVFRAGVFHRWEQLSDGPEPDPSLQASFTTTNLSDQKPRHKIPLRLLTTDELYTVNDVLGITNGPPDIDHIRVRAKSSNSMNSLAMLHSTSQKDSFTLLRSASRNDSMCKKSSGSSLTLLSSSPATETTKKKVGFAPQPPPYNPTPGSSSGGGVTKVVQLDSTDGLVVASVFLPVHLHRSPEGEWSADWDYEALLSMQTHLRVTRVGVVKWRGWHGNFGKNGSEEKGVPEEEREDVEACLRAFHCVPVWVEPSLFGEM